ncbi:gamma-glutamyl-gamma-aminobutyrate hydrolase [Enterobacter cloacae]|uniref:Gamma-glutamyl-gamma-aminobutyrate hydrolase n=1 Tax=Enterobacter cloacae TaxID=550 RepID=A0A377M3C1_ENTCL|nr:gamma-glutamyl-gamma-aminobutyrate hydrolase [Enterobacter cloacae]
MENIMNKPVIGVVMCRNRLKGHETQTLQEKYLNAIINAGGLPVALPHALAEPELITALLPTLDGIYLPGSPSNVQPHLYGENGDEPDADPGRDLLSMALIAAALERRIPIFAICRGCRKWLLPREGRCIAACSSRTTCLSTGKILNCRLSYNTPLLMKFRFRREDCCLN